MVVKILRLFHSIFRFEMNDIAEVDKRQDLFLVNFRFIDLYVLPSRISVLRIEFSQR